jgi:hypothetical protein
MIDRDRLRANADAVRRRVADACRRAGRDPSSVTIVAVTKTVDAETADALIGLGLTDLGENRAVEGAEKIAKVRGRARWHFIGHLQTNKVKRMLERFEVMHSVDRLEVALELEKRLAAANRRLPAYVEVNVSGEPSKGGQPAAGAAEFVARLRRDCPHLDLQGLMTMAPNVEPEATRPVFRALGALAASCGLPGCSMGMTNDFEVAVEEGATCVRIGSAFFEGLRNGSPPDGGK